MVSYTYIQSLLLALYTCASIYNVNMGLETSCLFKGSEEQRGGEVPSGPQENI